MLHIGHPLLPPVSVDRFDDEGRDNGQEEAVEYDKELAKDILNRILTTR